MTVELNSVPEAVEAIRRGEVVIVVDAEDRENEGDYICAAETATPEVVNFMLLKDLSDFWIHRLRIIHLYEADFSFLLGTTWKSLINHAEHNNLLHPGQFGGISGCESKTLPFMEELRYDICYLSRKPMASFDGNAMACYDQIIANLAFLTSCGRGQH